MSKDFKKCKRSLKRKEDSQSDSDLAEETVSNIVRETKELQKLRKKPKGVNAEDLAKIVVEKQEKKSNDTKIMATGGFIDIKALKKEMSECDDIMQIGTNFAVETNRRDEDTEMVKYVEEELAKIKGKKVLDVTNQKSKKFSDDLLYEMPSHLKGASGGVKKKTEDMISNQMLSGIPEVDLGIDVKIRNIEATEEAKQRLLRDRLVQKDRGISDFVPTNVAVNFIQHNRYMEDTPSVKPTVETPKPTPLLRVGDADFLPPPSSIHPDLKATDDFHFEKFKKNTRQII